jgi:hypothetical protein
MGRRFLARARCSALRVRKTRPARCPVQPAERAEALLLAVRAGERFDVAAALGDLQSLSAAELLAGLDTDAARGAFWTNLYNARVIDAVARLRERGQVRARGRFFHTTSMEVGGLRFSLHAIEHGILRCGRPAPWTFWSALGSRDARRAFALREFDPRVHFLLNCGARSCPPIRACRAELWSHQLEIAARSYISSEATLDGDLLRLPALLRIYARDFPDPLAFARPYLSDEFQVWLTKNPSPKLGWGDYDWTLGTA